MDGYRQVLVTDVSDGTLTLSRLQTAANAGSPFDDLIVTQNSVEVDAIVGQAQTLVYAIDNDWGLRINTSTGTGWRPMLLKVLAALNKGAPRSDYTVYVVRGAGSDSEADLQNSFKMAINGLVNTGKWTPDGIRALDNLVLRVITR
jgi:hypothetical protein